MERKQVLLVLTLVVVSIVSAHGADLSLGPKDLRIEQSIEGGYYLYVRKKADISSVLLTESTEDPSHKSASYAWRNTAYHPENGNEKRILDGGFLERKDLYFLVDSSPVDDKVFGQAFRIFIPWVISFGYPWARYGETQVLDGTWVSIRTFEKQYADYTGAYQDNPFTLRVTQKPMEGPPEGNYMDETVATYKDLAKDTNGITLYSKGEADLLNQIKQIIKAAPLPDLDLILCIDATKSMENDLPFLKKDLIALLKETLEPFKTWRIGVVQYRDYLEDFLYQVSPFTSDFALIQKYIDKIRPAGGRDIPEAVNEALYASLREVKWVAASKMIILVGDAPPHPIPRGKVSGDMVRELAQESGVKITTIILPQ